MHEWPGPDGSPQPPAGTVPPPPAYGPPQGYDRPLYDQPLYDQPANSQPVYGPPPGYGSAPAYGPPAYHQPGYGQQPAQPGPGRPGYAPGYPGIAPWLVAPPLPVKRSRVKVFVIVGAALLVGIVVLATVLGANYRQSALTAASHTLTLPDSSGPYVRVTTPTATRLGDDLAKQVRTAGSVLWTKPVVGIYGVSQSSSPSAIFIGGDAVSNPHLRTQLHDSSLTLFIDGFMTGAHVPTATDFPAGKFGGILRCGAMNAAETACVWVDGSTVGTLVLIHPRSLQEAASATVAFRADAEH